MISIHAFEVTGSTSAGREWQAAVQFDTACSGECRTGIKQLLVFRRNAWGAVRSVTLICFDGPHMSVAGYLAAVCVWPTCVVLKPIGRLISR